MDKKLHFLVIGEGGRSGSFSLRREQLWVLGFLLAALAMFSAVGWWAAAANLTLRAENLALNHKLATVKEEHQQTLTLVASREEWQQAQLASALLELRQRGEVIESIINAVGITVDEAGDGRTNVGGPFIVPQHDESFRGITSRVDNHLDFIQSMPLGSPVPGTLTSPFGRRLDPFHGRPAFHNGIDISNREGTRISAPAAGVVVRSAYNPVNGYYLKIDHGNDFKTGYLHLQRKLVKAGDLVERGQDIALLGNTGRSTGPHLHYIILHQGQVVDPFPFVMVASALNSSAPAQGGAVRGQQVQ